MVWDLDGDKPPRALGGHENSVLTVALTMDGTRAVSGSYDGSMAFSNSSKKLPAARILRRPYHSMAASASSKAAGWIRTDAPLTVPVETPNS